ncbi:MAG: hypothetical protein LW832_05980 [Parachlamydia sp.]|jgi:hypothetical protein|nr:hypothetical protein [Parachlamydia sp.]
MQIINKLQDSFFNESILDVLVKENLKDEEISQIANKILQILHPVESNPKQLKEFIHLVNEPYCKSYTILENALSIVSKSQQLEAVHCKGLLEIILPRFDFYQLFDELHIPILHHLDPATLQGFASASMSSLFLSRETLIEKINLKEIDPPALTFQETIQFYKGQEKKALLLDL